MIDMHCHILPGVDDGAPTMDVAVEMARMAHADGIHTIVATPHYNRHWKVERRVVLAGVSQLQRTLQKERIPVNILPGNEVRIEKPAWFETEEEPYCTLADGGKFVLLEQTWGGFEPTTKTVIQRLRKRGITAIIPHPERHEFFRQSPTLLDPLLEEGAWLQVTVDSLLGHNGVDAQTFAYFLLDQEAVHLLATDAHNTKRAPRLATGFVIVEERMGKAMAEAIRQRSAQVIA